MGYIRAGGSVVSFIYEEDSMEAIIPADRKMYADLGEAKAYARQRHKELGLDLGILHVGARYMVVNLTMPKRDLKVAYPAGYAPLVWCICAAVPHDHWTARTQRAKKILENK
jgi:hypothetical protein